MINVHGELCAVGKNDKKLSHIIIYPIKTECLSKMKRFKSRSESNKRITSEIIALRRIPNIC